MKTALNVLEIKQITKELQELKGARIDKIYQPDGFLIRTHKTGQGKKMIKIEPNKIWITQKKPEMPTKIPHFCTKLRKELEGKKITQIKQLNNERIIQFTLETQKEKKHLIIELFANGNLIITDSENKIICAQEERAWKDRTIKKGQTYKLPPTKKHPTKLKPPELGQYKTLSEKIDSETTITAPKPKKTEYDKKKEKLQKMIKAQKETAKEQEKKAAELQKKGEKIYEKYQELTQTINTIKQEQKTKSLQEIQKQLKKLQTPLKIKKINPEKQTIIVEV
ncbi:hypothetical protein DRJ22_05025 [Candidatus Woesearchaeota archaeon]|nr:MAG: hypothetical protein DRJ22_05025 [Candidatus Woesearchaeota archaeon]